MMPEILSGVHADFKPVSPKTRRALSKNRHQYIMKSNLNLNVVNNDDMKRTNSFVVGQKLRESKWFPHEETGVFCAVVESGFIVEVKNETEETHSGVVLWTAGFGEFVNWS